jgi:hypothetical protein
VEAITREFKEASEKGTGVLMIIGKKLKILKYLKGETSVLILEAVKTNG